MPEQSEEKTLPASDKKLRDARRRGQVPHSKDLVSGAVFLVTCAYLQASWTRIADQLQQLIDVVAGAPDRPFAQAFDTAMALAGHILSLIHI